MPFELIDLFGSRSIPEGDTLRGFARAGADATVIIGGNAEAIARVLRKVDVSAKRVVAVELGTECLGFHVGEEPAAGATNVVGFARFRLGKQPVSPLVELVRQRTTAATALAAATAIFEAAGLEVVICGDTPGRIVDSLLRPYLNSTLRSVDEGLAEPADLDQALRLGLGYPKGPIELLEQTGIDAHHQISGELYEALGAPEFLPARRARVAAMRKKAGLS